MKYEKEIAKMAKVLYGHYCGDDECGKCKMPNCAEYHRAEWLYKANYRNATEVREQTVKELLEIIESHTHFEMYGWLKDIVDYIKQSYGIKTED